jgi:hypothetical protein
VIVDLPRTIDSTLELRLRNWTRWARQGHGTVGHCSSIEYRYKTPQCWWPEEPRTEIDLLDAILVERAARSLSIHFQKPMVLYWVLFWAKREASGEIPVHIVYTLSRLLYRCYGIGLSRTLLPIRIAESERMVRNKLLTL